MVHLGLSGRKTYRSEYSYGTKGSFAAKKSVPGIYSIFLCGIVCVYVCFLPIHSGHQVRWTYQPGSHRRKITQDFSYTFLLRCVRLFFSREGFSHSFPSSTVSRILCTNDLIVFHPLAFLLFVFIFLVRKIPFAGIEVMSQRVRRLHGYL